MLLGLFGVGCLLLTGASALAWQRNHTTLAIGLLMGAALLLRLLMASLDPFLHDWDERFHAVVARNMVREPLRPLLRAEPLLPYDYQAWCCNHIWLHKQPLFLWQMALSLKLFGFNTLALRLPSILLSSLLLWPVYRLGALALGDALAGYLGALLVAFTYYQLELVSGALGMDHNDVAFLGYVTASIWAYYEYRVSTSRKVAWLVLVGILAGAAVLCKWLTGLLVYAGWGFDVLLHLRQRRLLPELSRLAASALVAVAVLLPWQLYTAWRFPRESAYERAYNTRHFTEVLEGHEHPWFYHFQLLPVHYGLLIGLIAVGSWLAVRRDSRAAWPLLAMVALIYLFFTLAATKMYSYTYAVSPLLLLLAGLGLAEAVRLVARWAAGGRWLPFATSLLVMVVVLADLRPLAIIGYHRREQTTDAMTAPLNWRVRAENAEVYRHLAQEVPAGYTVLNVPYGDELDAMFFSGHSVYAGVPNEADIRRLQARGVPLAAYAGRFNQGVPGYLKQPGILQLWGELQDN